MMKTDGTFTFTVGDPIHLHGFADGAAVAWSQDQDTQKKIKNAIEEMFDVFSDNTYPYEDFYQPIERGFLQAIIVAKTVNEAAANWAGLKAVATLSAIYRLDLNQEAETIMAWYGMLLKKHPAALALLSDIGVMLDSKPDAVDGGMIEPTKHKNEMEPHFPKGSE